eukprot:372957-Rhodomonas_salina.2
MVLGHAASWCKGYPEICPSPNWYGPTRPSSSAIHTHLVLTRCYGAMVLRQSGTDSALWCYQYAASESRHPDPAHALR